MQLSGPDLRHALALASCALVHGTAQADEGDWTLSSSLLYYSEVDRVTVTAPTVFITKEFGEEESLTLRSVYDSLTGASPNGATPTNTAQTFTGASGQAGYTTPAGKTPLKQFEDTRVAVGIDWSKRISPVRSRTLTFNASREEDYLSRGGSGTWTFDVNNKLTTLATAIGASYDTIEAHGGAPVGLQSIHATETTTCASGGATESGEVEYEEEDGGEDDDECRDEGEHKTTLDFMLGLTQVLTRRTLTQLNYTVSGSDGYLTDPYKIVSIIDPLTGATVDYVYEKRPSRRLANIIYWKLVHHFDKDIVHLSYRHYTDDWGVTARSTELQYTIHLSERFTVEPQIRYHVQEAADFYRHSLPGNANVDYASADFRLGAMTSTTVGLKLGAKIGRGDLSLRVAQMVQEGDSHPDDAIGIQKQFDLYPKLEAVIVNLSFSAVF